MLIKDLMTRPPAGVSQDATLEEAARHMAEARVGALPVVEDEHVVGMITDRDLVVRAMARGVSPNLRVEALMSTDPVTVEADTPVPAALYAMRSIDARHLPVVDHGRLVGVISFDDLFCFLTGQLSVLAEVVNATRSTPDPLHRRRNRPAAP
ncbi:CBS domain-containing protein [Streptomyces sp. NPDC021749]|uniref:CBS domain-containing protein n=1 Tax=Streptomyces sp. NPDC021749 TaxID=3154905 RepID=UPI0033D44E7C